MQHSQRLTSCGVSPAEALRLLSGHLGFAVTREQAKDAWERSEEGLNGFHQEIDAEGIPRTTRGQVEEWPGAARWRRSAAMLSVRLDLAPLTGDHELLQQLEATGGALLLVPQESEALPTLVVVSVRGTLAELIVADGETVACPLKELSEVLGASGEEHGYRVFTCRAVSQIAPLPRSGHGPASFGGAGGGRSVTAHIQLGHGHEHAGDDHHARHAHMAPWQRLMGLLRPDRWDILAAAIYSFVVSLLALATPLAAETLVNFIGFGAQGQPLLIISVLLLGGLLFGTLLKALQLVIAEILQQRLFVRVVGDLAWRLPRVQQAEYDRHHGPELLNRFFDVMTVQKTAALLVLDGVAVGIQFIVGMIVLAMYNFWFLGLDLILILAFGWMILVMGRGGIRTAIAESWAKYAVAGWLEQVAQFANTFKGAGGPSLVSERADSLTVAYIRARQKHFTILMRQVVFVLLIQALAGSLLLGFGGWLVISGDLTLGQLIAAELILGIMIGGFAKMAKFTESFYDLMAAVDKLGHLFDLRTEEDRGETLATRVPITLTLRNASAHLHGTAAFDNLNVSFGPAGITMISGDSGAGKSLLLDLAYGLRHPTKGLVLHDRMPTSDVAPESLRESVALLREVEIFPASIRENITMGRPGISGGQIRDLLHRLGLSEEVVELPAGLDLMLATGGGPLTTSQAKRVQLARCLVGRPRLLLIDGFLDSLSPRVLQLVMAELRQVSRDCTVIIVSSREELQPLVDRHQVWPPQPHRGPERLLPQHAAAV